MRSYGSRRWSEQRRGFEATSPLVLGRRRASRGTRRTAWYWVRVALLALVISVAAAAGWVLLDDRFYVYGADVQGAVRVSPQEVFGASDLMGLHVLWVRPSEAEERILSLLPRLESADVTCRLPARCTIAVVERRPRMIWDDAGELWWVDAEGVVFPALPEEAADVGEERWVVRGPLPTDEDGRVDQRVRVGLAELWAVSDETSPELRYVAGRGLVITDRRGWRVIVGQGTGMEERLLVLEWVAADLQARGLVPRFVDVRFPDAPYYSLTNEW